MRLRLALFISVFTFCALCAVSQTSAQQPHNPQEKLVWQESFHSTDGDRQPDPAVWTYDQGDDGWGNGELETYCTYGSVKAPCNPAAPNVFTGTDGYLHIVARRTQDGKYTSTRMLTRGLKTFQYGRFEARIKIPSGQGLWPAFWLLGEDIQKVNWPACGELDVMEIIGKQPALIHGSVHGTGFKGPGLTAQGSLPGNQAFADDFHRYGMTWSPGKVEYYVDDPSKPYAVYTPADMPAGGVWPFDQRRFFLILNLAVGGSWPGSPDAATPFPAEMLVDFIKVWQQH